jgi:uncharacterized protein YndB with AHSA1/START domain
MRTDREVGMAVIRLTQEIDRPVADVFATVVDGGEFASWNPTVDRSRRLTPGQIGDGTRFEWKLRGFGNVDQELQEFEPNRQVRIVPHHRSLAGGHRFRFTDLGGRTRVEHELEMQPRGVFVLLAPLMKFVGGRNLRATAAALKQRVESGPVDGRP